ncbi:MAG: hypothetical protein KY468_17410 [Armatimonadetes bacterium]|nr:hypothetical protein [Armatimonadota bacterium]
MRKAPEVIHTFDASALRRLDLSRPENAEEVWDTLHLLAALQGIVNRRRPRLYLFYTREFGVETDRFWFDWLRGEDGWLSRADVKPLGDLESALKSFRRSYKGLVVYDPKVPATSNVASTAAGVESLLPVRYDPDPDSLYHRLIHRMRLPVRLWLVGPDGASKFTGSGTIPDLEEPSSGSAKVDTYRWALARYLKTRRADPRYAAYYVDADWLKRPQNGAVDMHTLTNHDYFIAKKAFFFDLSPWGDERPNDDLAQPLGADREMMLRILQALYDGSGGKIVKIGGFPPWPFKYTTKTGGKHEGVPTEWEFTRLISQFNAYHEADAANVGAMANASYYQHYPLAARYPQPNPKPGLREWQAKGYVTSDGKVANRSFVGHYVGDYDAPAWLYKAVAAFFPNPKRGQVPLGWAFDPNLADRAPHVFEYAYRHATPNDYFIAGDSGAGYLNPRALTVRPDSGLPSGLKAWQEYCERYYRRFGMSITGFVLDGTSGASTDTEWAAYKTFSPDGFGTHYESGPALHLGVPAIPERDLPDDVETAAAVIARDAKGSDAGPVFQWRRSVLKSPDWYARLSDLLYEKHPEARVEVVDPYTLFGLIRLHLRGTGVPPN